MSSTYDHFCDKCKNKTSVGELNMFRSLGNCNQNFDLCDDCYSEFRYWMREPSPKNDPKPVKRKHFWSDWKWY